MKILAIDDEEVNLDIIKISLERGGYEVLLAKDGVSGLKLLLEQAKDIDIVLLDRMMPNMDGMEFLKKVKENEFLKEIPVIMQTAAATTEQVSQGIEAGVFYYLTKPFQARTLMSIVNSAAREVKHRREMSEDIEHKLVVSDIMTGSHFHIRSPDQARKLGMYIGKLCKRPNQISIGYGISELLLNGIEHGNLGIGYELKNSLLKESADSFRKEVERRLALPENKEKYVELDYKQTAKGTEITITDQGDGFNYKKHMSFDPNALNEPNGRGVTLARIHCKHMQFNDKGNQVIIHQL